jgi:predicted transcriptional regulator
LSIKEIEEFDLIVLKNIAEGLNKISLIAEKLNVNEDKISVSISKLILNDLIEVEIRKRRLLSEETIYKIKDKGLKILEEKKDLIKEKEIEYYKKIETLFPFEILKEGIEEVKEVKKEEISEIEENILILLYEKNEIVNENLKNELKKRFNKEYDYYEINEALEKLLSNGLIAIKSAFTAMIFFTTYSKIVYGLTDKGYEFIEKIIKNKQKSYY